MALATRRRRNHERLVHHSDRGGQGGFKRSSQRLESEELRWQRGRFVGLIVRCGLRCGRLGDRRAGGVSIRSGFGKGSPVGCRASKPVWRLVCRLRVGSRWFRENGGMAPFSFVPVSGRYLSFVEREEIAVLHARQCGVREIARHLGRSPSTISRELRRNAATRGGGLEYRATNAHQWHSDRRASRPKVSKLASNDPLRKYVQDRLGGMIARPDGELVPGPQVGRSGGQHLGRPHNESMRISHEGSTTMCKAIDGGQHLGAPSRFRTGSGSISPIMSPCGFLTRRSTRRFMCKAEVRSNASW